VGGFPVHQHLRPTPPVPRLAVSDPEDDALDGDACRETANVLNILTGAHCALRIPKETMVSMRFGDRL
jgi:hypothetical protein